MVKTTEMVVNVVINWPLKTIYVFFILNMCISMVKMPITKYLPFFFFF